LTVSRRHNRQTGPKFLPMFYPINSYVKRSTNFILFFFFAVGSHYAAEA
jgi:hypothetical protein